MTPRRSTGLPSNCACPGVTRAFSTESSRKSRCSRAGILRHIGIPEQDVERRRRLAEQVVVDPIVPDQGRKTGSVRASTEIQLGLVHRARLRATPAQSRGNPGRRSSDLRRGTVMSPGGVRPVRGADRFTDKESRHPNDSRRPDQGCPEGHGRRANGRASPRCMCGTVPAGQKSYCQRDQLRRRTQRAAQWELSDRMIEIGKNGLIKARTLLGRGLPERAREHAPAWPPSRTTRRMGHAGAIVYRLVGHRRGQEGRAGGGRREGRQDAVGDGPPHPRRHAGKPANLPR